MGIIPPQLSQMAFLACNTCRSCQGNLAKDARTAWAHFPQPEFRTDQIGTYLEKKHSASGGRYPFPPEHILRIRWKGHPVVLSFFVYAEERIEFLREPFGISGYILIFQGFCQWDQRLPEIPDAKSQLHDQAQCPKEQFSCFLFSFFMRFCDLFRRKDVWQILIQSGIILFCKGRCLSNGT